MSNTNSSSEQNSKRENAVTPQNIDPTSLGVVISGVNLLYNVYKGRCVAKNLDEPLLITIRDSRTSDSEHGLIVSIMNCGFHTVYIESFSIKDPQNTTFELEHASVMGSAEKKLNTPIRLMEDEMWDMKFIIPKLNADRLFVTIRCNYRVLGEKLKMNSLDFPVAIRANT